MPSFATDGYDGQETPVHSECRKTPRIRVSEEVLRDPGTRIDHRSGRRRSVGNLNLFGCRSSLRIRHAVDRATHVSTDGRNPTDVRAAGHGYGARAGGRGADLLSTL